MGYVLLFLKNISPQKQTKKVFKSIRDVPFAFNNISTATHYNVKATTVEAKAAVMRRMKLITLTLVIETNQVMSFLPSSMSKKKLRGQPQHVRKEP